MKELYELGIVFRCSILVNHMHQEIPGKIKKEAHKDLRGSFISAMMHNEFTDALESCRGVLNVIAGKVSEGRIEEMNDDVDEIEKELREANQTYVSSGGKYWKNYDKRIELKKWLEDLWRNIEQLQDEYGYGMFSEDDSGL